VRIVVAPDSFKGSIGARDAAAALAAGWQRARPGDELVCLPLADGGEGTLEIVAAATPAAVAHRMTVTGPDGRPVAAGWLALPDGGAVVELARSSGLPLMGHPDPLGASTAGLGEVIAGALDDGARRVTIGLGGSASTDGGTGALAALGARFLDAAGRQLRRGGGALHRLAAVDTSRLRPPPPGGVRCLADVRAPLCGSRGAAAVFGPQKGAEPGQVELLETGLRRLAALLGGDPDAPGSGAAGGAGYGFAAAWGASIVAGGPELCRIAGLRGTLAGADLVITGEGCYDTTSAEGKVVGAVLEAAAEAGIRAVLVAGLITAASPPPVAAAVALCDLAGSAEAARSAPGHWLTVAGRVTALGA